VEIDHAHLLATQELFWQKSLTLNIKQKIHPQAPLKPCQKIVAPSKNSAHPFITFLDKLSALNKVLLIKCCYVAGLSLSRYH